MCTNVFIRVFFLWLFQFTAKFFLVVVSIILKMETISARGLFTCQSWCVSSSRWCRLCVFQSLGRVTHFIRTDVAFGRLIKCTKIDFVGRDMKQSSTSIPAGRVCGASIYLPISRLARPYFVLVISFGPHLMRYVAVADLVNTRNSSWRKEIEVKLTLCTLTSVVAIVMTGVSGWKKK